MIEPPEPDPRVQRFENGVAVLRSKGQFAGYVLSIVGTFWSPFRPLRRQWWIWFLVVWADGKRERPFEDYPPGWLTVDELERGQFTWSSADGDDRELDAELLGSEASAEIWRELGITAEDF